MGNKWILYLSAFALVLSSCSSTAAANDNLAERKIKAVATTGMVADTVRNVAGERAEVTGLMGPGIDPHLYKASEGNVITLANADIIFYNGLHLEAQLGRVFERMQGRVKTVPVAEHIDPADLLNPPEFEGQYDPHIWFDIRLWMQTVESVREALIEIDPLHAQVYNENADRYLEELEELDDYIRQQAQRVPAEKRVLVTAHDAFNYFGKAYGFEVRGLQGISTNAEASTADVQSLAALIVERQIPAIFIESSVPTRTIEAVQAAVRARGLEVRIGGELFSDALGDPGTPEGTFTGMAKHNIDTIVGALLGETHQENQP